MRKKYLDLTVAHASFLNFENGSHHDLALELYAAVVNKYFNKEIIGANLKDKSNRGIVDWFEVNKLSKFF